MGKDEYEDATTDTRRSGTDVRWALGIVTPQEFADALGVHVGTLKQWRYRGVGPHFTVAERRVYYRIDDLKQYLAENARAPMPGGSL